MFYSNHLFIRVAGEKFVNEFSAHLVFSVLVVPGKKQMLQVFSLFVLWRRRSKQFVTFALALGG